MATIIPFLQSSGTAFDQNDITTMSRALNEVCAALNIRDDFTARETMAVRIIELARQGEHSSTQLRDRVLHEAAGGHYL